MHDYSTDNHYLLPIELYANPPSAAEVQTPGVNGALDYVTIAELIIDCFQQQ